jgi:asparagine N-glycosylation enzyme membrane subunit Stt3
MFCNTIPAYWLNAMQFIESNIGPAGPRVLSWWDYGDWINWFGQTPAVLRGDNSVPKEDFATAASYVLNGKDGYGPSTLANFMNTNQTGYVLFDQDLIGKWGALDFLACININATSRAFAISQGQQQTPQQPYVLGTSACEISHDPQFALVPLSTIAPSLQQPTLNSYCSMSSNSTQYAYSYLVVGQSLSNQTACMSLTPNANGAAKLYYQNGTSMGAVVPLGQQPEGEVRLTSGGPLYLQYLVIYLPSANGTVTKAPTGFYQSNFYKGFFLGELPGFTEVYPSNSTGINFVNGTYPVRIYRLNDFTGQLPPETPKPSYVTNNYTLP